MQIQTSIADVHEGLQLTANESVNIYCRPEVFLHLAQEEEAVILFAVDLRQSDTNRL